MANPAAQPYWSPSQSMLKSCRLSAFRKYCLSLHRHLDLPLYNYEILHRWSVEAPAQFWAAIWTFFRIVAHTPYKSIVSIDEKELSMGMPRLVALKWFDGARVNFAENILCSHWNRGQQTAVIVEGERGNGRVVSRSELCRMVARVSAGLREFGIETGDVVAGLTTNDLEALVLMLATTACGAIWTSAAPEFGVEAILSRWAQVQPSLVVGVSGYQYKGKWNCILEKVRHVVERLRSVRAVILIDDDNDGSTRKASKAMRNGSGMWPCECVSYSSLIRNYSQTRENSFIPVSVDDPVYVMYSSGTTGPPKCIVQSFGVLLNHIKEQALHLDMTHRSILLFASSTGWMMWNWMISAIFLGTTVILYNGHPFPPWNPLRFIEIASRWKVTHLGASPKYLAAVEKAMNGKARIRDIFDLKNLKFVLLTGSPSSHRTYEFVSSWSKIPGSINYVSISGGTDINGCFLLGCPWRPTYIPELTCAALGANVQVWSDEGYPVTGDTQGELVCLSALPSMPRRFHGDKGFKRYRDTYFEAFGEHVWYHGDFVRRTKNGGWIIAGRSDATLNPGGQRIGSAEIYAALESSDIVEDAVIVAQQWKYDVRLLLFIVVDHNVMKKLTWSKIVSEVKNTLKKKCGPRHVPEIVLRVSEIPETYSGKKMEVLVKRIVDGRTPKTEGCRNPECLEEYRAAVTRINQRGEESSVRQFQSRL